MSFAPNPARQQLPQIARSLFNPSLYIPSCTLCLTAPYRRKRCKRSPEKMKILLRNESGLRREVRTSPKSDRVPWLYFLIGQIEPGRKEEISGNVGTKYYSLSSCQIPPHDSVLFRQANIR